MKISSSGIKQDFKALQEDYPITLILGLAILFRLLAAIFARGWGMIDDHFLVIESAQSWVDGYDYNSWLPGSIGNIGPTGHNLFYPGFHFLLFSFLKLLHVTDPQVKMVIVRLIHATFSLITVYYGYRITEQLGGKRSAFLAGILLAIFWFMPWMSVRNLVEMVCVPFLVLGYWYIIKPAKPGKALLNLLLAGIFFGFAADLRLQSVFIPIGIGLLFLFQAQWQNSLMLSAGVLLSFALVEGTIDFIIWGRPFLEIWKYAQET